MKREIKTVLVTGGAGFIGANFIRYLITKSGYSGNVVNVDKLTYAGNLENLKEVENDNRYKFHHIDINDYSSMKKAIEDSNAQIIVNFAAESHVDRSIYGPKEFIDTNIMGTFNLLEIVRELWKGKQDVLFHHVSTDEVYGSLDSGTADEDYKYYPNSPYAASKASSDHLVRAYNRTYGIPCTISNCSNNYGPLQFPEKVIPLMIINALEGKSLPIYGEGVNVRDWLYVEDHCKGIWKIVKDGMSGEVYNIGADNEWKNIDLVKLICKKMSEITGKEESNYTELIEFVKDRPGHDLRYSVDSKKIRSELGWEPGISFEEGIEETIKWYMQNKAWVENVKSGEYRKWLDKHYK